MDFSIVFLALAGRIKNMKIASYVSDKLVWKSLVSSCLSSKEVCAQFFQHEKRKG